MRVVMTGGGGFIGSHLLARMVGAGIDVTLIGLTTGKSRYTASLVSRGTVRFLRCDDAFTQEDALRVALGDADALVLLGYSMPPVQSAARTFTDEVTRNVLPILRLLRVAEGRTRHIVFASSVSVYGDPDAVPVRENDRPRPRTPFAAAKLAAEQWIEIVAAAAGWRCCALRYATVYGPGETVPRAIPNFIRAALAGQPPVIDGDGLDESDYVHVADVVDATMAALRRGAEGVYNVGTGIATTTRDVAGRVVQLTGCKAAPVVRGAAQAGGRPVKIVCSTERAAVDLGFNARHTLTQGLAEEIGWFRSRPDLGPSPVLAATA